MAVGHARAVNVKRIALGGQVSFHSPACVLAVISAPLLCFRITAEGL